jgi:hypothetical protein
MPAQIATLGLRLNLGTELKWLRTELTRGLLLPSFEYLVVVTQAERDWRWGC